MVAVALQNVLAPVVDLLVHRGRFPRALAVASSILVGLGVLTLLGTVVVSSIRELTRKKNMHLYQETLEALLRRASHLFDGLREGSDSGDPLQDLPIADAVVLRRRSVGVRDVTSPRVPVRRSDLCSRGRTEPRSPHGRVHVRNTSYTTNERNPPVHSAHGAF